MAFSSFHCLIILFCSLVTFLTTTPSSLAKTSPYKPKVILLPVTKDASTLQYLTTINQRTPLSPIKLTLDLGGRSLWVDCEKPYLSSTYKPTFCGMSQCDVANAQGCAKECHPSPRPGCNNNTCVIFPENPLSTVLSGPVGQLGEDVISLHSLNGRVVSIPNLLFACGDTSMLSGLANGIQGMAGLGRSKISIPSQLSSSFKFHNKFALCLSSSAKSKGSVFVGNVNLANTPLTNTKLILNPVGTSFGGSTDYFIDVNSVKVNGKVVSSFNRSLLTIDSEGYGGTKISTLVPYTVLQTSIYKAVVSAFVKQLAPRVRRVKSIAPFGACFDAKNIRSTRVGPVVPPVDLVLGKGVVWRFFGAKSMVQVKKGVLCLGFVDAGWKALRTTAIVIGGHQIEDNLLQFDLINNRLGFSSSLLFRQTTCANFNFTSIA